MSSTGQPLRCSLCGKSQNDVRKLIAGPNVSICDECVDVLVCALCNMPTPPEETLHLNARGPLCQGCVGEIEAALAARRTHDNPL